MLSASRALKEVIRGNTLVFTPQNLTKKLKPRLMETVDVKPGNQIKFNGNFICSR